MRTPLIACTGLALALFTLAGTTSASSTFVTAIPNGTCIACHTVEPQTNSFGAKVVPIKGTPMNTWWPTLWQDDSDNDGQTNGQELGDPCGTWTMGQTAPRTTNISNPGDLASKSMDPHTPSCPLPGGGGAGGTGSSAAQSSSAGKSTAAGPGDTPETVTTGACASIAPTSAGGAAAAAWLALALVAVKRRRRR